MQLTAASASPQHISTSFKRLDTHVVPNQGLCQIFLQSFLVLLVVWRELGEASPC